MNQYTFFTVLLVAIIIGGMLLMMHQMGHTVTLESIQQAFGK